MQEVFNTKKHMIHSSILFNFLIIFTLIAYLQGYKWLWLLLTALILPIYLYSMKSKRLCTIKEGFLFSFYTTIPLYIISVFLFLISLLIAPLGLLFIPLLLKYACIIWTSVFLGFIILNLCFVWLYKLISKTSFYKNWKRYESVLFLYLAQRRSLVFMLICSIIVSLLGIYTYLSKSNLVTIVGISQLIKRDSFFSKAIVYDKNKLLVVYRDLYEVFDIDKKERIKWGKIDGLKYKEDLFSLNKINDEEVFIANLLEYNHKNVDDSHLFNLGILNLKNFSYKSLGEYTFNKSSPSNVYPFDKGKILIVGDSTEAYILDDKNLESFKTEEWTRPDCQENMLIPYKNNYLLIYSEAWQHDPEYICAPLIQEFNLSNKTLKTVFKQEENSSYRTLKIALRNNTLLIVSINNDVGYKLRVETIDLEKMEKISENIIEIPDNEFSICSCVLQGDNLLIFVAETVHRTGFYCYNLDANLIDKKLNRITFLPEDSDKTIVLKNNDIINYGNIHSEGKIYLFKNLISNNNN